MAKRGGPRNTGSRPLPSGDPAQPLPDKLYFRIGEVAGLCRVPAYVLRFWQTEFPQLRPGKSGTGQRLYRRRDLDMALRIKHLLHEEGYTIPGARALLDAESAVPAHLHLEAPAPPAQAELSPLEHASHLQLLQIRAELTDLLSLLRRESPSSPLAPSRHVPGSTPPA